MFRIIHFNLLLKGVLFLSFGLSIILFDYIKAEYASDWTSFKLLSIASATSFVVVFLLTTSFVARPLWALMRRFNKNLYPDLNGMWEGAIRTSCGLELDVRVIIRQSLLKTELDMFGKTTKSVTLECTPQIECGQKRLYYVYRSTPINPEWGPYDGSTLFDVIDDENGLSLSGHYYTSRLKSGRVYLTKISNDTRASVSYY
ncbi:hypothetical protein [Vibrio crassostreae]|uniref:Cap15 family cyclic dinucleotide receptor domain-containing protein n=1 Tax=Vibrio crassostreae TaxID=246167 RepID=UPI001B304BFF|nr:hypothetical protein [Vibrio crassostreae]CAH7062436.1 S_2TMBeta domain-containing protein [Vibrio chagasii]CAH7135384.1 S_2TMBeta domain-containing protein [Vibrio chagasii]CAK3436739.1 SMODS-associating 2TM beta-strand rich effector domain-containing protein [Vibrio crassostreae]CAK3517214.1 SMODS-associating 2TM beta-strand rich effector domain-containing protein [Vibrio crassostreae]CAK3517257.1 SMODS-associating 2TM beta-strand rich effector domain-containing protein [Vibrio crassostre